ncbi:MAG: hypothetical protein FWB72_04635 [Firmicutes bacterium]|nr:hypothetical protein [Bacillota bacterium]
MAPYPEKEKTPTEITVDNERKLRIIHWLAIIVIAVAIVVLLLDFFLWETAIATILSIISHIVSLILIFKYLKKM